MTKQTYEDYKYMIQDTGTIGFGAKYSYGEIVEKEEIPFKFRAIIERYIIPDMGADTTLESHLYYMQPEEFSYKTYMQIKVKVKFNRLVTKKKLFGKPERVYITEVLPLREFVKIPPADKEKDGIFIQEMVVGKFALMSFVL